MVIAETAAAAFEIRLLHVNAVAEFTVTRFLIVHAELDIFAFRSDDTFGPELLAKLASKLAVAGEKARFEHRRFGEHVAVRLGQRFFDRASRMTNFEPNVPQGIQNLLRHLFDVRGNFSATVAVQQHHVDIAERIQFAPAVTAERDQRQRCALRANRSRRSRENVSQNDVDQFAPPGANLATATAGLMS